jgi:predicted enzyme related to lactoylglutathione lyase
LKTHENLIGSSSTERSGGDEQSDYAQFAIEESGLGFTLPVLDQNIHTKHTLSYIQADDIEMTLANIKSQGTEDHLD